MSRDAFTDIAAILHPRPLPPSPEEITNPDDDGLAAWRDEQDRTAEQLRGAHEEAGQDPLIASLTRARHARDTADEQIRQLLAYAREFVEPRPYPLVDLAAAGGFRSPSGVRTAYDHDDVAAVAAATGAKPRSRRAGDPEPPLTLDDLVADLQRRCKVPDRVAELYDMLEREGWTPSVPKARTPGARTTRRYIVWRRTWPLGTAVTLYQAPSTLGSGNNIADGDPRRVDVNYAADSLAEIGRELGRLAQRVDQFDAQQSTR